MFFILLYVSTEKLVSIYFDFSSIFHIVFAIMLSFFDSCIFSLRFSLAYFVLSVSLCVLMTVLEGSRFSSFVYSSRTTAQIGAPLYAARAHITFNITTECLNSFDGDQEHEHIVRATHSQLYTLIHLTECTNIYVLYVEYKSQIQLWLVVAALQWWTVTWFFSFWSGKHTYSLVKYSNK